MVNTQEFVAIVRTYADCRITDPRVQKIVGQYALGILTLYELQAELAVLNMVTRSK